MILIDKLTTVLGVEYENCVVKVEAAQVSQGYADMMTGEEVEGAEKFAMEIHFDVFKYEDGARGENIDIGARMITVPYPMGTEINAIAFAYDALKELTVFSESTEV